MGEKIYLNAAGWNLEAEFSEDAWRRLTEQICSGLFFLLKSNQIKQLHACKIQQTIFITN